MEFSNPDFKKNSKKPELWSEKKKKEVISSSEDEFQFDPGYEFGDLDYNNLVPFSSTGLKDVLGNVK